MKREELKNIIPEITDDQIDAILNLRSAEIGKSNRETTDLKEQVEKLNKDIAEYKEQIAGLEKSSGDTEALNNKIKELQDAINAREEADKEAKAEKALTDRFNVLHGDKKYINDFTRNGVFAEFKAALDAEEHKGKSDADIFAALTKDRSGIFENPNPMSAMGNPNGGGDYGADDAAIDAIMGITAQNKK